MLGAIAATTSRASVGSWVLSALHRNPGVTVKAVETLDEISGGRFIFGFGAGHAGRQGEAFGFPADVTVGRYAEALEVVMPLIREGRASFDGRHHRAVDLPNQPRGHPSTYSPRPLTDVISCNRSARRILPVALRGMSSTKYTLCIIGSGP